MRGIKKKLGKSLKNILSFEYMISEFKIFKQGGPTRDQSISSY